VPHGQEVKTARRREISSPEKPTLVVVLVVGGDDAWKRALDRRFALDFSLSDIYRVLPPNSDV